MADARSHNQGNQDRKYTLEQKTAVLRVRRCAPTAFYEILGLEEVRATVTESEIKKAYRKLSLLTHPDKNGHEHADEAFKMVSRAFGVLSDKDKKTKYDRFGGDPDSRFGGGSAPQSNPFSGGGFGQRSSRAQPGGGMWEEEISPEEMFNRFFGGGMGGGFGGFGDGGGPGFVFNLNGGPGIRVHQFGGGAPRRRPRDPNAPPEPPQSLSSIIMGILPLLIVFIGLPLLSGIFGGESNSNGPAMRFDAAKPPYTMHRNSHGYKKDYWIDPKEVVDFNPRMLVNLDQKADVRYVQELKYKCALEQEAKRDMIQDAQGWIFPDMEKLNKAHKLPLDNCVKLGELDARRH